MPRIAFEACPKLRQIAFVAFQMRKKVEAREQQHAGDVVTLVVAARRRDHTVEMRRFERGRRDTAPSQASHHVCRRKGERGTSYRPATSRPYRCCIELPFRRIRIDCGPPGQRSLFDTAHLQALRVARREGVTEAAGKFPQAGLIKCQRGSIAVIDRPGLEARCCECYKIVKTEFDRCLAYVAK